MFTWKKAFLNIFSQNKALLLNNVFFYSLRNCDSFLHYLLLILFLPFVIIQNVTFSEFRKSKEKYF